MRAMVIVKPDKNTEEGILPDENLLIEMENYNEELVKTGLPISGEGLHPRSKGARVKGSREKPAVTDGPFAETKELIAGFRIWQVKSMGEALEVGETLPDSGPDGRAD
jgi:hypothetical protein